MSNPAILSNMSVFRDVPQKALGELCILAPPVNFSVGATVFEQGKTSDVALLLIEGRLEVEVESSGKVRQVGQIRPGEIVGEQALFSRGGERSATVRAGSPSKCLLLSNETMERAHSNPAIVAIERHLLATLARRIRRTNQEIQKVWKEAGDMAPPDGKRRFADRLRGLFGGRR